jgi:hypothetical protein
MTIKVRGSAADRSYQCAGSIRTPDHTINPTGPDANSGVACHEAAEPIVVGLEPDLDRIADEYGVESDDLGKVVDYARIAWREIKKHFPMAETEVRVEGPVTRGRVDILSVTPELIAIGDWKSGYSRDEHPRQLMGYADAARAQFFEPSGGIILGVEIWLRLKELRIHHFTMPALDGFRKRIASQIKNSQSDNPDYAPGPHCTFCPHSQCKAREEYNRSTCQSIAEVGDGKAIQVGQIGALWERSRMLKKALASYESLVDDALLDGPLDLGDGRELRRHVTEVDSIKAEPAAQVLANDLGFTDGEVFECMKMSKGSLLGIVRRKLGEKPPRGEVGKSKTAAMRALHAAGAVGSRTKSDKRIVKADDLVEKLEASISKPSDSPATKKM